MDMMDMEEIRVSMEDAQEAINDRELLIKLSNYEPFKKIVGKMYFEHESIRLVGLMGEDNLDESKKLEVQKAMYGIAYFQRYLRHIDSLGTEMINLVKESQDELNRVDPEVN